MANTIVEMIEQDQNIYLIPPYLDEKTSESLMTIWKNLKLRNHVFLCSSGTSSGTRIKSYALSKDALFANARAVNEFLNVTSNDVWMQSLPSYHVGGLSIIFRTIAANNKRVEWYSKWNPFKFYEFLLSENINYCSIVPTQLYDLVKNKLSSPPGLKGIFVGGDFMSEALANKALQLNWPIIQTFGMTEVCSQLASSYYQNINNGLLDILPVHNVFSDNENFRVFSPCLFTCEITWDGENVSIRNSDPEGFIIPDEIFLSDTKLRPLGRKGSEVKIKGRLYNFLDLKNRVDQFLINENIKEYIELTLVSDEREGAKLNILVLRSINLSECDILKGINNYLPKPLQLKKVEYIDKFNRTALGKIKL